MSVVMRKVTMHIFIEKRVHHSLLHFGIQYVTCLMTNSNFAFYKMLWEVPKDM